VRYRRRGRGAAEAIGEGDSGRGAARGKDRTGRGGRKYAPEEEELARSCARELGCGGSRIGVMMDETSGGERCGSKRPGFFFLFERKKHQAAGFFYI
jgi:hypothetical protein